MSMGRYKCEICADGPRQINNMCRNCYDEAQYWKAVDEWAMEKRDGATLHLKPQRRQGRSRF